MPEIFDQTGNCASIPPGGSCSIDVIFKAAQPARKKSAILNISSNDPKKSNIKVRLKGRGI